MRTQNKLFIRGAKLNYNVLPLTSTSEVAGGHRKAHVFLVEPSLLASYLSFKREMKWTMFEHLWK